MEAEGHEVAAPLCAASAAALAGYDLLPVERHARRLLGVAAGRGAVVAAGGGGAAVVAHHGRQVEANLERILHGLRKDDICQIHCCGYFSQTQ